VGHHIGRGTTAAAMVHSVLPIDACFLRDFSDKQFHMAKPAKIISIPTRANNNKN